jgi:hypothetical protein
LGTEMGLDEMKGNPLYTQRLRFLEDVDNDFLRQKVDISH